MYTPQSKTHEFYTENEKMMSIVKLRKKPLSEKAKLFTTLKTCIDSLK